MHSLRNATPKTLLRRGGRWYLHLERLARLQGSVYRPARTTIAGRERILELVAKQSGPVEQTRRAMEVDGDVSFDLIEGSWIPSEQDAIPNAEQQSEEIDRLKAEVRALRRELHSALYTMNELKSRLMGAAMSMAPPRFSRAPGPRGSAGPRRGSMSTGGHGAPMRAPKAAAPPREMVQEQAPVEEAAAAPGEAEEAKASEAGAADAPADAKADAPAEAKAEESAEAAPEATEEQAPAEPEEDLPDPIAFCTLDAYEKSLEMLLGDGVSLSRGKEALACDEGSWVCILLDDEDVPRGAMFADLECTVDQGCRLLMLPEAQKDEQLSAGAPTEDVIESMSEIFNTQSATLNQVSGNPHLRTTPLAPPDFETYPWLKRPRSRLDIQDGTGRCAIISR